MKKTFNMRKVVTPVLLHLLEGELRFPRLFLWRCALTQGRLKAQIDSKFPRELIDLAALPLWIYINLKVKLGQKKAFEIMRVAVLTGGTAMQNILLDTLNKDRNFKNFSKQELEINKTGSTKWNSIEVVENTDQSFRLKVTRCLYHELAKATGVPEVTPIICQIDNAVFNSYLPDKMTFHRGGLNKRISDGNTECHFVWEVIKS